MNTPCENCPFRSDIAPYLRYERAIEITGSLEQGGFFPCHKTVDYDAAESGRHERTQQQWCAGAMILMEKSFSQGAAENQMVRIMSRIAQRDLLEHLDMDASVPASFDEWISSGTRRNDAASSSRLERDPQHLA